MKFNHKSIPSIRSKFKNIKNNIIVIGGGRWAKIILIELILNFENIDKIIVITGNKKIIEELPSNIFKKKLYLRNNLNNINLKKITHAIVANKNKDHFSTSKRIIENNINVLVEKPLVSKIKEYEKLKKLSQKKRKFIHVSTPFFFAYYFFYIKKFIATNNPELCFEWHDPKKDKRHGFLKKYDKSITYLEDTSYHIYGILNCIFGKKKIVYLSSKNFKDKGNVKFEYGKIRVNLNCSRNIEHERIRKIKIICNNKNIRINYSNDKKVTIKVNSRKIITNFKFCQKTLKYQLFNFLNTKKYSKNYSLNDIRNFNSLIHLIKYLR